VEIDIRDVAILQEDDDGIVEDGVGVVEVGVGGAVYAGGRGEMGGEEGLYERADEADDGDGGGAWRREEVGAVG